MKTKNTLAIRPFPEDVHIALKVVCAQENRPMTEVVPELLRDGMKVRAERRRKALAKQEVSA